MAEILNILSNIGDATFAVDYQQRIVLWNTAAETLFGISTAEALGQPCWQLLQGETPDGRPFCGPGCPILDALHHNQPVRAFHLLVNGPAQKRLLTTISTLFVLPDPDNAAALVHIQCLPEAHSQWPEPL
ncbi:MAG: PAS domain-containing protein [Chloroflexi bacterium]|nr:PAS domain-containing protein [Chloroflexota bacterium]